jgi:hypothetical protein
VRNPSIIILHLTLDFLKEVSMESIWTNTNGYPGRHIKLEVDDPDLAFAAAKDIAKQKAQESCDDPMLLSWYNGDTGQSYPDADCGPGDKPAWIIYAESRGGDLTVDINQGRYVFIFLSI